MNTAFSTLFTIVVHHEYCGGIWRDVDYIIPPETQKTLNGLRWHVRIHQGVLKVFGTSGRTTPHAIVNLKFGLRSDNGRFPNFTELPARNSSGSRQMPLFRVPDSSWKTPSAEPVRLEMQHDSIDSNLAATSAALNNKSTGPTNQRRLRSQVKEIKDDLKFLHLHSVFAIVKISLPAEPIATIPPDGLSFVVALAARKLHVIYRIIATKYSDDDLRSLSITEVDFDQDGRTDGIRFKVDQPGAVLPDNSTKLLTFRSEAPITLRRRQPSKFQLRKNGEILISALRQPGEAHPDNIVFVALSKT